MKITTINYKQKFPTFQFLNCDIGFKGTLGENEDPLNALKQLKTIAEAFHKQEFPHLYNDNQQEAQGTTITPVQEERVIDNRLAVMITDINQCTEIDATNHLGVQTGLIAYKEVAESHPELKAAFDLKMAVLKK